MGRRYAVVGVLEVTTTDFCDGRKRELFRKQIVFEIERHLQQKTINNKKKG